MSASLGVTQLKKLDWMIAEKVKIAFLYNKYLGNIKSIILPKTAKGNTHSWFVYVIRITNGKRNYVMNTLLKKSIQTKSYLPVIHLQPFMKKEFGYRKGDFPISEKVSSETLALPLYIGLKDEDIKFVCDKIKKLI
jgi:perosamine synthetase